MIYIADATSFKYHIFYKELAKRCGNQISVDPVPGINDYNWKFKVILYPSYPKIGLPSWIFDILINAGTNEFIVMNLFSDST